MMDLWITECKLIFIMNISVLDFFKFSTRMPQILVSTFKILQEEGGGMALDPLQIFPWAVPGSE